MNSPFRFATCAALALLAGSSMLPAHADDDPFASDDDPFADHRRHDGRREVPVTDLQKLYHAFRLEREEHFGENVVIQLIPLSTTKAGSTLGTGRITRGRKELAVSWCLVPHPGKGDIFVISIQAKPYNDAAKISRYVISAKTKGMVNLPRTEDCTSSLLEESMGLESYHLTALEAPRKAELVSRKKRLAGEGAFKLFATEEKELAELMEQHEQHKLKQSGQNRFETKVATKRPDQAVSATAKPRLRKMTQDSYDTTYSYIIKLRNASDKRESASVEFTMKDEDGFMVARHTSEIVELEPGETKELTGSWEIENKLLSSGQVIEAVVEQL